MNTNALIQQIKKKARVDARKRKDPRYLDTMGFLVAKGFLRTNQELILLPNKKLRLDDAIWAGQHVEPRILEVLPAAVLRLRKHFDLDLDRHKDAAAVIECLQKQDEVGPDFFGVPYDKIRVWANFPLRDKRVKLAAKKKVVKTFRLEPEAIEKLKNIAKQKALTVTEALEELILGS